MLSGQRLLGATQNLDALSLNQTNSIRGFQLCLDLEDDLNTLQWVLSSLAISTLALLTALIRAVRSTRWMQPCESMTYDKIIEGKNSYLTFNSADQELIDSFPGDTSFGGNLTRGVFQAKKRLLTPMGLTDMPHPTPAAAKDTSPGEPSLPAGGRGGECTPLAPRGSSGVATVRSAGSSNLEMATQDAEVSDAGGGNRGIGESSGNWHVILNGKGISSPLVPRELGCSPSMTTISTSRLKAMPLTCPPTWVTAPLGLPRLQQIPVPLESPRLSATHQQLLGHPTKGS